jgi:transcriptional regulator with XRE-family HTH domain
MSRIYDSSHAESRRVGLALKALRVRTSHLRTGERATQARVAELAHLSVDQIRRIEQGRIDPTFGQVDRVLVVLGVNLAELQRLLEAPMS